jgi:N-hydroxyarylamine O-acetyltransferase
MLESDHRGQTMSSEFHLNNYLTRIGYKGAIRPDLETLCALHAAHLSAIPFEAIDPLLRRPVSLDLDSLQHKLVDTRRGGYCFEQNALFKAALEAIGFKITGLAGRVRWMSPPESPLGPKVHMMLKVELAGGAYLADVGFGACLLDQPLKLETDIDQDTGMGTYRLSQTEGLFSLAARRGTGWRTMYVFDLQPQIRADYDLGNHFTSTSRQVPFTGRLIMERLSADRRYKLVNRKFVVEVRDGEVIAEQTIGSADQLRGIIDEKFHVTVPVPAAELFDRTAG